MKYTLKEHQGKTLFPKTIQEFVGTIEKVNHEKAAVLNESAKGKSKRKLVVNMEAIHTGRTKNFTYYTEEGLKAGLKSWTQPYNKPVLTHHNDQDGEAIGRILEAAYSDQTLSGKPGLVFTVEITDPQAIEKVLDGRYQTVSIGANTDRVTCNMCGTDRTEDWCEHYPGEKYDEQVCHFIVGTTYGREVSYVNTPADENAGNRTIEVVDTDENGGQHEHVHMDMYQMAEGLYQNVNEPNVNLYEHLNEDVKNLFGLLESAEERSKEAVTEEEKAAQAQAEAAAKAEDETKEAVDNPEEGASETPVEEADKAEAEDKAGTPETPVAEAAKTPVAEATVVVTEAEKVLQEKVSQMQKVITEMVLEKAKTDSKLSEALAENDTLIEENQRLLSENHKALAEKVVDMKLSLRKTDVVGITKEEAINNHLKRTAESLNDSLADLMTESAQFRPEPGSVKNPGASEEEAGSASTEEMSAEDGLKLFTNMFAKKKR